MARIEDSPQLSNLSAPTRFITTHDASGKAIVHSSSDFQWRSYDKGEMAFSVQYTTSQSPPDLNSESDIASHEAIMATGKLGLVNPGGSVLRWVDFAPGCVCLMHRTQSLDYGIVVDGRIDMALDSGELHHLKRGDVAIQRATQHRWINPSQTEWTRMVFILQECKPLVVDGKHLGEDLAGNTEIPPSEKVL